MQEGGGQERMLSKLLGVLQAWFAMIICPVKFANEDNVISVMKACIVLHNNMTIVLYVYTAFTVYISSSMTFIVSNICSKSTFSSTVLPSFCRITDAILDLTPFLSFSLFIILCYSSTFFLPANYSSFHS